MSVLSTNVWMPRFASRLWFHALPLACLGPLWLAAIVTVFRHVKSGDAGFGWWAVYLGVPIPLTVWGLIFLFHFGPVALRSGWGSRLLFACGLLGGLLPLLLLLMGIASAAVG